MAQDHFKTLPGPKRGHIRPKKIKKSLKVRAKPAKIQMRTLASCMKLGQQRGFPRGSISSLGALGGAWIWV